MLSRTLPLAKHQFSIHERWAVYKVHGDRCYLGTEPIDLKSMQVDHILPESLLAEPSKLVTTLAALGLPANFDLNSYENWLPACATCNNQKRARVFDPAPIVMVQLQKAKDGAAKCRILEDQAVRNVDVAKSLAYLERASDRDELDHRELEPLIIAFAKADPAAWRALTARLDTISTDFTLGLQIVPEFRITPTYKVLFVSGGVRIVQTPHGTGYLPSDEQNHSSFFCGHCGSTGPWSGARCLSCGMLDDGD